jgi:flagellar biosynthesis chaperone FliJ
MFFSNLLNKFSNYEKNDVERNLEKLRGEYEERLEINKRLKKENYRHQYDQITNFIKQHSDTIESQLAEIKELSQKIKDLIEENDTLIQDEEICDRLVESPEVKKVVEQLEHLEVLRMDINFFLSDRKVVIVPQDP